MKMINANKITRSASQKGHITTGCLPIIAGCFSIAAVFYGIMTFNSIIQLQSRNDLAPAISGKVATVQPYVGGKDIEGVVVAESRSVIEGYLAGTPGIVSGYELLVRMPDGNCYGFRTESNADATNAVINSLDERIGMGSNVHVTGFDPAYNGMPRCEEVKTRYMTEVLLSQIRVIEK